MKKILLVLASLLAGNSAFAFEHTYMNMTPYGVQLTVLYVNVSICRPDHKVLPAQTSVRVNAGKCALQKVSGVVDVERSGIKTPVPLTPFEPKFGYGGDATILVTGPDINGLYSVRLHTK